jgi:hypothetical protein
MARGDVYAAIRDGTKQSRLVFGRNKRVATPIQKLAMLMYSESCATEGCNVSALECDAHHIVWYEHGGPTNIDNLEFRAPAAKDTTRTYTKPPTEPDPTPDRPANKPNPTLPSTSPPDP